MTSEQKTARHISCSCLSPLAGDTVTTRALSGLQGLGGPGTKSASQGSLAVLAAVWLTVALLPSHGPHGANLTGLWQLNEGPPWIWKPSRSICPVLSSRRRDGPSWALSAPQGERDWPTLALHPPLSSTDAAPRSRPALSPEPTGAIARQGRTWPTSVQKQDKGPPNPHSAVHRRVFLGPWPLTHTVWPLAWQGPVLRDLHGLCLCHIRARLSCRRATSTPSLGSGPLSFPPQTNPATRANVWPTRLQLCGGLPPQAGDSGSPQASGDRGKPVLSGPPGLGAGHWCHGQGSQPSGSGGGR